MLDVYLVKLQRVLIHLGTIFLSGGCKANAKTCQQAHGTSQGIHAEGHGVSEDGHGVSEDGHGVSEARQTTPAVSKPINT